MFTPAYVKLCQRDARFWADKTPCFGDVYVDWQNKSLDVISTATLGHIDFHSGRFTYLPTAGDLLELIDNQVEAWGSDPASKTLRITYDPQEKWCAEIHYAGRITFASRQNSIEELLYHALKQMIYFDPSLFDRPDQVKRISIARGEPCHN